MSVIDVLKPKFLEAVYSCQWSQFIVSFCQWCQLVIQITLGQCSVRQAFDNVRNENKFVINLILPVILWSFWCRVLMSVMHFWCTRLTWIINYFCVWKLTLKYYVTTNSYKNSEISAHSGDKRKRPTTFLHSYLENSSYIMTWKKYFAHSQIA